MFYLISSNWCFRTWVFWAIFAKTPVYPGSSLTSPEQSLRGIWRGYIPGLKPQFSSVAQLCLTLWDPMDCTTPGFPCPSPSPGACSNSCPLSQWCHPTISSSVITFSCLQSFPVSGSFPVTRLFISGGRSIEASASSSVLLMNIQGWSLLQLTGLISLQSKGLWRVFSNTIVRKHQLFGTRPFLWFNSDIHTWLQEKP